MSCNKANNCKKYKMNIGNPNDWENPCNRCDYNISDYDIGYNKALDDFAEKLKSECREHYIDCDPYFGGITDSILYEDDIEEIAEQLKAGEENE